MLQGLLGRLTSFANPVSVNDRGYLDSIWNPHRKEASKELGNFGSAFRTLRELEFEIGHSRYTGYQRHLARRCCGAGWCTALSELADVLAAEYKSRSKPIVVGDPRDVAHIIPPRHRIGYVIYKSKDGRLTLERIEGLYRAVEVLRRKGRIIAVMPLHMMRMESYGNVHIG